MKSAIVHVTESLDGGLVIRARFQRRKIVIDAAKRKKELKMMNELLDLLETQLDGSSKDFFTDLQW